jgi:hypothetical protein
VTSDEILALYDRLHLAELEGTGAELSAAEVRVLRDRLIFEPAKRPARAAADPAVAADVATISQVAAETRLRAKGM